MNWQLLHYQREVEEGDFPIHFHTLKILVHKQILEKDESGHCFTLLTS